MRISLLVCAAVLLLSGCGAPPKPEIKFASYGAEYHSKPDFAQLEYKHPIAPDELKSPAITSRAWSKSKSTSSMHG